MEYRRLYGKLCFDTTNSANVILDLIIPAWVCCMIIGDMILTVSKGLQIYFTVQVFSLVEHGSGVDMWNLRLSSFLAQLHASILISSTIRSNNTGSGYQQSFDLILNNCLFNKISYTGPVLQNLCTTSQGKFDALVDDNLYHGDNRDFLRHYYRFHHMDLQSKGKALDSIFIRVLLQPRSDIPSFRCIQYHL